MTFTTSTSTNPEIEKYVDNTYLELEEFDMALKKYNIYKINSACYTILAGGNV